MTAHKSTNHEVHRCSWCNYPGATHEGGIQGSNGDTKTGWFCSQDHFERWCQWQSVFTKKQINVGVPVIHKEIEV